MGRAVAVPVPGPLPTWRAKPAESVNDSALTPWGEVHNVRGGLPMNAKLLLKTVFLIAMLLLLVLIGLYNKTTVDLALPPVLPQPVRQPAAIMYFAFFAVGVLTGTVLTVGTGKRGSSGGGGKSGKD